MILQSKAEIKNLIGKKSFFKEIPKTKFVLAYVSGVGELDIQRSSGDLPNNFFIARYPEGILISDRKGKYKLAFSFSNLKNVEITKLNNESYEVVFSTSSVRPVVFSFQRRDRLNVVSFVKLLPHKEDSDPRQPEVAREQILKLKHQFVYSYFTDRTFKQVLKSAGKKNMLLDINEHRIKYGDREINVKGALGYSITSEKLSHSGLARMEYGVNIYHPEGNLFISFTSLSISVFNEDVFNLEGKNSNILAHLGNVLFDVICRPVIAEWFDRFANLEEMNYKDFSITRGGLLLKSKEPKVLIHWDEIVASDTEVFRWPYSNTVFQEINVYDVRGIMLLTLTKWLQKDPERLKALMGRTYFIS